MAGRHLILRLRPVRCGHVSVVGQHKRIALTDHPAVIVRSGLRRRANRLLRGHLPSLPRLTGKPVRALNPEQILAVCEPYDVISFDIFDTLLCRCVREGQDVFRLLEMQTGQMDFADRRRQAEAESRGNNGETTLAEIYQTLAGWGVVNDVQAGCEREMAMEHRVCRPVEPMPETVRALKRAGKRIVAASDMYLPSSFLAELLRTAGYPDFDRVYVSCEQHTGKAGGGLISKVRQDLHTDSLLHIGDNMVSDVLGAIQGGVDAGYWANRPDLCLTGEKSMTMAQSVHQALCAQRLSGSVTPAYAVGYAVGGLITLGFCRQLQTWQVERGWDKLLFAARDGYIMHQVYTRYFGQADYVPISRAACQMLTAHQDIDAYVDNNFVARIGTAQTFRSVLIDLSLGDCLHSWQNDMELDAPVSKPGMAKLKSLMKQSPDRIRACFAADGEDAFAYFSALLQGCGRVALADTGWKGSSGMQLNRFLKDKGLQITIDNALLGTSRSDAVRNQADAGRLVSYLYGPGHHRAIMDRQFRKGTIPCTVMEMLFAADLPPLLSYRRTDGSFTYGSQDTAFADRICQQQQGILDFVEDFLNVETAVGLHLPVTADDAYAPFDALTGDVDALLCLYGDHIHGASPTAAGEQDTFAAMLRHQHWITSARYLRWRCSRS